jgi:hypothetical protein
MSLVDSELLCLFLKTVLNYTNTKYKFFASKLYPHSNYLVKANERAYIFCVSLMLGGINFSLYQKPELIFNHAEVASPRPRSS